MVGMLIEVNVKTAITTEATVMIKIMMNKISDISKSKRKTVTINMRKK